ncbi:MAG TPA: hypothetical protein PLE19_12405, partial [Planctomycetota bacterium]|nr:hypothetical protein [Planctomycetota bacterium]
MGARNKKIKEGAWPGLRGSLGWLAAKMRLGILSLGLQGALVVALVIAAFLGIRLARGQAARLPQFCVYPAQLRAQAPPWCAPQLEQVQFPRDCYSIFDPHLTRDVAEAY